MQYISPLMKSNRKYLSCSNTNPHQGYFNIITNSKNEELDSESIERLTKITKASKALASAVGRCIGYYDNFILKGDNKTVFSRPTLQ